MTDGERQQTETRLRLQDLEDKILRLLKEAKGNILDDEQLINTLNNSKQTSGMVQARVKEAEETERSINEVGPTSAPFCCGVLRLGVLTWQPPAHGSSPAARTVCPLLASTSLQHTSTAPAAPLVDCPQLTSALHPYTLACRCSAWSHCALHSAASM